MIDGNISMEEDTELRDLVVQTLENNGILAKVRAELRAGVFLTLEEQESVLNPEPFLNKSIKQYLSNSEGKLLFSLVREFLEYFGLDYTLSVFDPETYCGKEYNYEGRKKLSQELGINSRGPLLGEILKNTINSALNNSNKDNFNSIKLDKTNETSENANATFDVSIPKVLQKETNLISTHTSEKFENESDIQIPMNIVITDKKQTKLISDDKNVNNLVNESNKFLSHDTTSSKDFQNLNKASHIIDNSNEAISNVRDQKLNQVQEENQSKDSQKGKSHTDIQTVNNIKNKMQMEPNNVAGKTVYFDEIIVDGTKEKLLAAKNNELSLPDLPQLSNANNSTLNDLPPLNGQKANMNDLKELIDIAQGVSTYEDNSTSSVLDNFNNENFSEISNISKSLSKIQIVKPDLAHNSQNLNNKKSNDKLNRKHLSN